MWAHEQRVIITKNEWFCFFNLNRMTFSLNLRQKEVQNILADNHTHMFFHKHKTASSTEQPNNT